MNRRDRLLGHRYPVGPGLMAEVRRSCRDELKIVYEGGPFGPRVWQALAELGSTHVLHASALNPAMKDLYRVTGESLRLEGPLNGERLLAFFARKGKLRNRHRVERALKGALADPPAGAPPDTRP